MKATINKKLKSLPTEIKGRIKYGLYGGVVRFFITDVDASLAMCGNILELSDKELIDLVKDADRDYKKLIRGRTKGKYTAN